MSPESMQLYQAGNSPFDQIRHIDAAGEYWLAREMQPFLAYSKWQNMETVLRKARASCRNNEERVEDHFTEIGKVIESGKGARLTISDVRLSRYACYLVSMNGDPEKPEVAAAQHYFLMATRAHELKSATIVQPRPSLARAWSERFSETMPPHKLVLAVEHPGHFSVVTALATEVLVMEDELLNHLFEPSASDRPDVSIGICWANYRSSLGLPPTDRRAPLKIVGRPDPVYVGVYRNAERDRLESWFRHVYMPEKFPSYLGRKPEFKPAGLLPIASVADCTCRKLTGRPAILKPIVRRQLAASGGFIPIGARVPMLPGSQPTLFD